MNKIRISASINILLVLLFVVYSKFGSANNESVLIENNFETFTLGQKEIIDNPNLSSTLKSRKLAILYFQYYRIDLLQPLLDELSNSSQPFDDGFSLFMQGFINYHSGNYTDAAIALEQAKVKAIEVDTDAIENKQKWLNEISLYIAINKAYQQSYSEALEQLQTIRITAEKQNWKTLNGKADFFLGLVNYELKHYESALDYYERAQFSYPSDNEMLIAESKMAQAQMINIVGDRQKAFTTLDEALSVFKRIENKELLASGYLLKAYFYSKDGQPDNALVWMAKSVTLREQLGNEIDLANTYVHYSASLFALEKFDDALKYAIKAVDIIDKSESLAGQWDAYVRLARSYYALERYKPAYEYMRKAERTLLKKARLDMISETARLNTKFSLEYEKLKNQTLDSENEILQTKLVMKVRHQQYQQWTSIILMGLLVVISISVLVIYKMYLKSKKLSTQDALTGMHNRRSILELGMQSYSVCKRYNQNLSVLMLDIDNFKQVNDNYGHKEGDNVLVFIANICLKSLRDSDLVGRIGGEEFLFVLPNTAIGEAVILAKRLCKEINRISGTSELVEGHVTVSIGVAESTDYCEEFSDVIDKADIALYEAKNNGRNQVIRFELPQSSENIMLTN